LLSAGLDLDERVLREILGNRRKIIFVEGTEKSLDKSLYSLIFPNVSIVPKASCREVEQIVDALRHATALNWVHAFGIVDNDTRSTSDIAALKAKGVYAISAYSVESIYYHPVLQERIARRQSAVDGIDFQSRIADAKAAAIKTIIPHILRLSRRAIEKDLRDKIIRKLPGQPEIEAGGHIIIDVDVAAAVTAEQQKLEALVAAADIGAIIERYPVRETPALSEIASKLGFTNKRHYEAAIRKLLADDDDSIALVRALFNTLDADLVNF
jgi:hypothetical protein